MFNHCYDGSLLLSSQPATPIAISIFVFDPHHALFGDATELLCFSWIKSASVVHPAFIIFKSHKLAPFLFCFFRTHVCSPE